MEEDYSSDEENPPTAMERLEKRRNTADDVTRKYSTAVSHNPFKMKMKLKKGSIPIAMFLLIFSYFSSPIDTQIPGRSPIFV